MIAKTHTLAPPRFRLELAPSVEERARDLRMHVRRLESTAPACRDDVEELRFLIAETEYRIARLHTLQRTATCAVPT